MDIHVSAKHIAPFISPRELRSPLSLVRVADSVLPVARTDIVCAHLMSALQHVPSETLWCKEFSHHFDELLPRTWTARSVQEIKDHTGAIGEEGKMSSAGWAWWLADEVDFLIYCISTSLTCKKPAYTLPGTFGVFLQAAWVKKLDSTGLRTENVPTFDFNSSSLALHDTDHRGLIIRKRGNLLLGAFTSHGPSADLHIHFMYGGRFFASMEISMLDMLVSPCQAEIVHWSIGDSCQDIQQRNSHEGDAITSSAA
ncbi:hypothetical protein BKA93DRAFT_748429 [Sparassis latifolia]